MYYVGDFYRSNGSRTAISYDWGLTWKRESNGNILRAQDVDPQPVYLSDGKVRLYFRAGMGKSANNSGVAFCDSDDGLVFDTSKITFCFRDADAPANFKLDPCVIKFKDGSIACYFGLANQQQQMQMRVAWSVKTQSTVNKFDEQNLLLQIAPIPVDNTAELVVSTRAYGTAELTIQSIRGETIFGTALELSGNPFAVSLDTSEIPSGVYCVQMRLGQERSRQLVPVVH
jgi:hypothetical protein